MSFEVRFVDGTIRYMPLKALIGARVRLLQAVTTRLNVVPAGTEAVVTSNSRGLSVQGKPCACCGVKVHIIRLPVHLVEVIELAGWACAKCKDTRYLDTQEVSGKLFRACHSCDYRDYSITRDEWGRV